MSSLKTDIKNLLLTVWHMSDSFHLTLEIIGELTGFFLDKTKALGTKVPSLTRNAHLEQWSGRLND
jgi:hypothetical protein